MPGVSGMDARDVKMSGILRMSNIRDPAGATGMPRMSGMRGISGISWLPGVLGMSGMPGRDVRDFRGARIVRDVREGCQGCQSGILLTTWLELGGVPERFQREHGQPE